VIKASKDKSINEVISEIRSAGKISINGGKLVKGDYEETLLNSLIGDQL
jgi:hypothetical protein